MMSSLALIIGLACIGVAIILAAWLIAAPGNKKADAVAGAPQAALPAGAYPAYAGALSAGTLPVLSPSPAVPTGPSPFDRPADPNDLAPLLQRLKGLAIRLSPASYGGWLRRQLDLAGNPSAWPADRILAFKGVGLVAGVLFGALVGLGHGVVVILLAVGGGVFGFLLPDILVYNMAIKRQDKLLRGLPDALDMMTVCVEAGLGFDSALSRVALNLDGPIATECARLLQEMQFGMSRVEALRSLADRSSVPEIRNFVSAMVQSSELGISIGLVLREQAKEMRIRRRQRAEEKAQKLQVKIVVPLVLCLLPALFVVVIGPGVLNIIHAFSHAHH